MESDRLVNLISRGHPICRFRPTFYPFLGGGVRLCGVMQETPYYLLSKFIINQTHTTMEALAKDLGEFIDKANRALDEAWKELEDAGFDVSMRRKKKKEE